MRTFNLQKQEFMNANNTLFMQQIITTFTFFLLLMITLISNNFWHIGTLKKEIQQSEQEVITTLKKLDLADGKTLTIVLKNAEEKVSEEEGIWFPFSQQMRVSFLYYLEKLSTAIDSKAIGLKVKRLVITQQEPATITLEGEVKDFDALKILERELKSTGLFVNVPSLQTKTFNAPMILKKNGVAE